MVYAELAGCDIVPIEGVTVHLQRHDRAKTIRAAQTARPRGLAVEELHASVELEGQTCSPAEGKNVVDLKPVECFVLRLTLLSRAGSRGERSAGNLRAGFSQQLSRLIESLLLTRHQNIVGGDAKA